jgi:alpha-1,6-mannosyltransferase
MTQRPRPAANEFVARRFKLSTVGALTALVYLLTLVFYLRGPDSHGRTAKELFAWFCVLTLLPLFHAGYVRVRDAGASAPVRAVVLFGALFCLIAVFVYPFHSTDVFGYVNRGWQQVHYRQNPYVYTTAEMPGWQQDPMVWEHWIYNPNPYGFLFTLLARVIAWLGGGNWALTLGLFKLLNAAAYAFTAWLVWKGARLLGHDRPAVALYAFMWNPLVLMHHIANGHNDILVGCLVALALYLAVRGAELWIVPVLVAATFLKYAPALLVPPALVFIIKSKGWKTAAAGCALGALVAVLVSLPYVQDWRQFRLEDIRDNASLIDNSLHSLLIHIYENLSKLVPTLARFHDAANTVVKDAIRLGFVVFLLVAYVRVPKDFSARRLIEKSVLILFVLVCVATSKFNAWYIGMFLPAALLIEEGHWLRRLAVLISCAELLSITFFKQAYMLNYFAMILVPAWIVFRQVRKESARGATHAGATAGD